MTATAFEEALAGSLPDGFNHTFYEPDRLRRLNNQTSYASNLSDIVAEYGGTQITEEDVILREIETLNTQFLTPERTIEFPGLSLLTDDSNAFVRKWASLYKQDNDTPSGTIKDATRASTDDIVFTFASPEVYNEIADTDKGDFYQTGLTAGREDLVGDAGLDTGTNAADTTLTLDPDEYLFFTGDFIDMSDGQSVVTATQWSDVDGESFGPVKSMFSGRLSGAHILTTMGTYATAGLDLDMKVYEDGDAELVPIAFYMGPGTKAPGLV